MQLTEAEIASRLEKALNQSPIDPLLEFPSLASFHQEEPKPAAVLIPLLVKEGTWHVLLTRRNADLPEHSGQVAYPGGRVDPEDPSLEATALREAEEEIGLNPADVHILGRLKRYLTITNYLVTPVVGTIPWPYDFHIHEKEVSRVFTIPIDWLVDPTNFDEQLRTLPPPHPPVPVIYFHPYDGETLWGASARFTLCLIQSLK